METKNYSGFAVYFESLGAWLPCKEDYTKGSAKGYFCAGILTRVISVKDTLKDTRILYIMPII